MQIVECLEHPDESVKRLTLDLLFKTTNSKNLEFVVDKMIGYLKSTSDPHFRKDLVVKIYDLNEAFTPSPEYFVLTTNKLFEAGSDCITNRMLSKTIYLIKENLENDYDNKFSELLISSYYTFLEQKLPDQMIKLIAWIMGDIARRVYNEDGPSLKQLSQAVVSLLEQNMQKEGTRAIVMNSLGKIMACDAYDTDEQVDEIMQSLQISSNTEIKQRAFEYKNSREGILALPDHEEFDQELSFLKPHIEQSIRNGQGKYDRTKNSDNLLKKLKKKEEENSNKELLTTHKTVDIAKVREAAFGPSSNNAANK